MKYILILLISCSYHYLYADNTDVLMKKHPLIGKTIKTPDFTIVAGGINDSYTHSPKIKEVNSILITLDHRLSTSSFPAKGMYALNILPPDSELVIKEVYHSKPDFIDSLFGSSIYFAIVENKQGNKFTVSVLGNNVFFQFNECNNKKCKEWRAPLKQLIKSNIKRFEIILHYSLFNINDIKGSINLKPPYPKEVLIKAREKLISFLKNKKISILEINNDKPLVKVKINIIQYGDLFLNYEELNIKSVKL